MVPFHLVLAALFGWLEREQRDVIEFLREENRVLKAQQHVRRKALDEAAKTLEPDAVALPPAPEPVAENAIEDSGVVSHVPTGIEPA